MEMRKKISIEVEDKVMEDLVSIILRKLSLSEQNFDKC